MGMRRFEAGTLAPEVFRFGVGFSDGRKATNLVGLGGYDHDDAPAGPMLTPGDGDGGGHHWTQRFWLLPLPPPGPLAFVAEWPALDLPLSRAEIDSATVIDAASRALLLWERR